MAEIHKTVTIDAPAEKVFDIVDDPENYRNMSRTLVKSSTPGEATGG